MRRVTLPAPRGAMAAVGGLLLVSGLAFVPASAGAGSGLVVLRDVRASHDDIPLGKGTYPITATKPQPDTQTEPSIAVNPANPLNAVAAFQEDRVDAGGDAGNGFATTFDGGRTWVHGYLPGLTTVTGGTFDRASDAVVTFGADPNRHGHYLVYANSLVFNDGSGTSGDTSRAGWRSTSARTAAAPGARPSSSSRTDWPGSTTRTGWSPTPAGAPATRPAASTSSGTASHR